MKTVSKPYRFQLSRARGYKMPPNSRSVSRPGVFGNVFTVGDFFGGEDPPEGMDVRPLLVLSFREWLEGKHPQFVPGARAKLLARLPELRGKNLCCWCPLPKDGEPDHCHAAVLIEWADK